MWRNGDLHDRKGSILNTPVYYEFLTLTHLLYFKQIFFFSFRNSPEIALFFFEMKTQYVSCSQ